MKLEDVIEYRDNNFRYSIKSFPFKGIDYWYVTLFIECWPVVYHGVSDYKQRGFKKRETAVSYLKFLLEGKSVDESYIKKMRALPLFIDGYTPKIKFE